jgi:hypothetical protein
MGYTYAGHPSLELIRKQILQPNLELLRGGGFEVRRLSRLFLSMFPFQKASQWCDYRKRVHVITLASAQH